MTIGYVLSADIIQNGVRYSIENNVPTSILSKTISIKPIDSGTGYSVEDSVPASGNGLTINILEVGENGEIVNFEIANKGYGYSKNDTIFIQQNKNNTAQFVVDTVLYNEKTGFTIDILEVGDDGDIVSFQINNRGQNYQKEDYVSVNRGDAVLKITDSTRNFHQIVYTRPEGGVGRDNVTDKKVNRLGGMEKLLLTYPQPAIEYPFIDLPEHSEFSNCWEIVDNTVVENMELAKNMFLKRLRRERDTLLLETDRFSVETASQYRVLDQIQARQYYLRNVPNNPAIEQATTTEELSRIKIAPWTPPAVKTLKYINKYFHRVIDSETYNITDGDEILGIRYDGSVILTLPEISTVEQMKYLVKDEAGNASANNIVINCSGDNTINGQASFTLSSDYGHVNIYHDSVNSWYTH